VCTAGRAEAPAGGGGRYEPLGPGKWVSFGKRVLFSASHMPMIQLKRGVMPRHPSGRGRFSHTQAFGSSDLGNAGQAGSFGPGGGPGGGGGGGGGGPPGHLHAWEPHLGQGQGAGHLGVGGQLSGGWAVGSHTAGGGAGCPDTSASATAHSSIASGRGAATIAHARPAPFQLGYVAPRPGSAHTRPLWWWSTHSRQPAGDHARQPASWLAPRTTHAPSLCAAMAR
jgi:hypothetical protein